MGLSGRVHASREEAFVWLPNTEQQIWTEYSICNFISHRVLKLALCLYLSPFYVNIASEVMEVIDLYFEGLVLITV